MSPLTRALLGAALTLPLVAFVAGGLLAPDEPATDRTRPVIVGQVSEDDTNRGPEQRQPDRPDRDRRDDGEARDDRDAQEDRDDQDDGPERTDDDAAFTVVTPAPRDLDDEDDGGGDDGDDGDDSIGDPSVDGGESDD